MALTQLDTIENIYVVEHSGVSWQERLVPREPFVWPSLDNGALRHDLSQLISNQTGGRFQALVKLSEESGIEQGMMRKFGKRNITDVVGFKMSEKVNQVGGPIGHVAWPLVIHLR